MFLKACCSIVHLNANVLVAKIAKEIVHHIEYVNYLKVHSYINLDFPRFIIREEVYRNQERILGMSAQCGN